MFWPLHRCGAYAFVLSHAVCCWCTQGSSILLLWCGACAFMFGRAVCCWCPQGSSVSLVWLWCRCCGVSQVMRMQALHVQCQQRWCWLRACPGSAAKHAQCQLVYLPDCASVADACQSACQFLIVVAALLGQRKQFSRCPDSLACCGRGVCGVSMCGRCGAVAH